MPEGLTSPPPQEVEKKPPFPPGERFAPEAELENIRRAPREGRRELVREFKEKLAYQMEGIAKVQAKAIEAIRQNPNVSAGKLIDLVHEEGFPFGLTYWQKVVAERLAQEYVQRHSAVRQARDKYPDDRDLYQASFGVSPKGKVEVVEGPITLYFRCTNLDDYAWIYNQRFLTSEKPGFFARRADRAAASQSGGVAISTSLLPELQGAVIAENAAGFFNRRSKESKESQRILAHEEQHAINMLLQQDRNTTLAFTEYWLAQNDEERRNALERYLRERRREIADQRAKNEMLAFFKEGRKPKDIRGELTPHNQPHRLYNYLDSEKKNLLDWALDNLDLGGNELMVEAIKKVFEVEYRRVLKEATEALGTLEKRGLGKEEIIAILQRTPLDQLPKVAGRLAQPANSKT